MQVKVGVKVFGLLLEVPQSVFGICQDCCTWSACCWLEKVKGMKGQVEVEVEVEVKVEVEVGVKVELELKLEVEVEVEVELKAEMEVEVEVKELEEELEVTLKQPWLRILILTNEIPQ